MLMWKYITCIWRCGHFVVHPFNPLAYCGGGRTSAFSGGGSYLDSYKCPYTVNYMRYMYYCNMNRMGAEFLHGQSSHNSIMHTHKICLQGQFCEGSCWRVLCWGQKNQPKPCYKPSWYFCKHWEHWNLFPSAGIIQINASM